MNRIINRKVSENSVQNAGGWVSVNEDEKPPDSMQVLGKNETEKRYEAISWSENLKEWWSSHIIPTHWRYIVG